MAAVRARQATVTRSVNAVIPIRKRPESHQLMSSCCGQAGTAPLDSPAAVGNWRCRCGGMRGAFVNRGCHSGHLSPHRVVRIIRQPSPHQDVAAPAAHVGDWPPACRVMARPGGFKESRTHPDFARPGSAGTRAPHGFHVNRRTR